MGRPIGASARASPARRTRGLFCGGSKWSVRIRLSVADVERSRPFLTGDAATVGEAPRTPRHTGPRLEAARLAASFFLDCPGFAGSRLCGHRCLPSTAAPTPGAGGVYGGRAGRVIAGRRDPQRQCGLSSSVPQMPRQDSVSVRGLCYAGTAIARVKGHPAEPCSRSWSGSQGRHILTDGQFRFQVPGERAQRAASSG